MENEKQSSVQILFSNDYGKFKFLKGNRDLNDAKIKRIIESVSNGLNLFRYCPIMVNREGYVIDGQHRFYVCNKLKLPIFYIVVPEFTLRQIAEMNQNASKWKDQDFVNCYVDTGNNHYNVLREFADTYRLKLGIAVSLLSEGKVRGVYSLDALRDGLFRVEKLEIATAFMDTALMFKDYCVSYKSRSFLQALEILLASEGFNLEEMFGKLKLHSLTIETCQSYKEYLTHLEDLFNYRNQKRKRIY